MVMTHFYKKICVIELSMSIASFNFIVWYPHISHIFGVFSDSILVCIFVHSQRDDEYVEIAVDTVELTCGQNFHSNSSTKQLPHQQNLLRLIKMQTYEACHDLFLIWINPPQIFRPYFISIMAFYVQLYPGRKKSKKQKVKESENCLFCT